MFTQRPESRKILAEYDCRLEAWSPLCEGRNNFFTNEVLARIGAKYGKSVSQVGLRWLIQIGAIAIPRSTKPEHLKENIEIFDFSLDDDDMAAIAKLDTGKSLFFDYHDPAVVKEFLSLDRSGLNAIITKAEMKKILSLIVMIMSTAMTLMSCAVDTTKESENSEPTEDMETSIKGKKTLVVFFSHTGENYGVGNIKEGNTHIIADMIGEATRRNLV